MNSPKSRSMRKQKEPVWLAVIRIALACVFLFSGLSKIIDPVASGIQMDDYFTSFGMGFMHPFSLTLGILMNIAEFTLGFMLFFRIRVRLTTLGYLLFMIFFFLLTAWLAVAEHLEVNYGYNFGVVKDCGCFGQAITMNNMETFLKNVVLMIVTLVVFSKRKAIPDIKYTLLGQWFWALVGACIALIIQIYCLRNLPLFDFSHWKNCRNCKNIIELYLGKPEQKEVLFLYGNDIGEERLLSMDDIGNILDSEPNFYEKFFYVNRIDSVVSEAIQPEIPGFSMLDDKGKDFATIYLNKEVVYLLFMHDLDEVSNEAMKSERLKKLVVHCQSNNIDLVGITNSPLKEIEAFIKKYNITFPIYYNPIDPIKGPFIVRDAIRSNPGLITLEKGVVTGKKAWRNF